MHSEALTIKHFKIGIKLQFTLHYSKSTEKNHFRKSNYKIFVLLLFNFDSLSLNIIPTVL